MKVIGSTNLKGGIGKTTTAVNISAFLGERFKVILVDGDMQGNASTWLIPPEGVDVQYELADVLYEKCRVSDALVNIRHGLDLLPTFAIGGQLPKFKDTEIQRRPRQVEFLVKDLEELGYDFIFFDLGPNVGLFERAVIAACHEVYTSINLEYFAVDGINSFVATLDEVRQANRSPVQHRAIVANRVNNSFAMTKAFRDKLSKIDYRLFEIPQDTRMAEAPIYHQTIFDYDPKSKTIPPIVEISTFLGEQ